MKKIYRMLKSKKHQINLFTYYTYVKGRKNIKANLLGDKYRRKLIKDIEKSINQPLKNSNFEFKIHYAFMCSSDVNLENINNFLDEKNIHVVARVPSDDKLLEHPNFKSEYFENRIHFDCSNTLNNARMGFVEHPNLFHTPSATSLIDTYNRHFPKIFENKKQLKLLYLDSSEESTPPELIKKFKKETESKDWDLKIVYEWQKDDHKNLKVILKTLSESHVILLDRTCWHDKDGKPITGKEYIQYRDDVFRIFIENECLADIAGFRITMKKIVDNFDNASKVVNDTVYNYVGDDEVEKLEVQDYLLNFWPKTSDAAKSFLSIYCDNLFLIGYLFRKDDYTYTDRKDFIDETRKRLKSLDGISDAFLKYGQIIYFDDRQRSIPNPNPLIKITNSGSSTTTRFHNKQVFRGEKGVVGADVSYKNFDFLTLDHVSIEENQFDISFNLELSTPFEEGIDILQFHNLVKGSMESKLLSKKKLPNGYFYFRYFVDGTYHFIPKAENYPFDMQEIRISYSLAGNRYGLLEPLENYHDDKIISDGWNIEGFRSGIIRRKEEYVPVFEESYTQATEEHRVEILISRPSSYTITKVLVPLAFLAGLAVWGTYLDIDQVEPIIASVTTAFLSAIALYFSTEKPKPLSLTTTDLIFLLFYLFVGLASLSIFIFMQFLPDYYYQGMTYTRWGLGAFAISSLIYIFDRVKKLK